jgi:hypothetical protein
MRTPISQTPERRSDMGAAGHHKYLRTDNEVGIEGYGGVHMVGVSS